MQSTNNNPESGVPKPGKKKAREDLEPTFVFDELSNQLVEAYSINDSAIYLGISVSTLIQNLDKLNAAGGVLLPDGTRHKIIRRFREIEATKRYIIKPDLDLLNTARPAPEEENL